ncbi:MAG TPA: vWA domain-containing protein [Anaerolineae bacterium]|nr:vWA domain-containing protein [Anaerolineae bacterium]
MINKWMTQVKQYRRRKPRPQQPAKPVRRWRRRIRLVGLGLIIVIVLACLACVLLGIGVGKAFAQAPAPGMDALLVIDNSNSMFDKNGIGSDPELRRIEAAQMFIHYLGVDSGATRHQLGVIFFGGTAHLVVPLTSLADAAQRAQMADLIAAPQRMRWTDPVAALTLARDMFHATPDADQQRVVVLLTDGKPEWSAHPTATERAAVLESLKRLGWDYITDDIRLFIVLLQNEATDADPEIAERYIPLWRELTQGTGGSFYAVRRANDLMDVYHSILLSLSDVQTAGAVIQTEVTGDPQTQSVPVEPYLARVTFVVRISPLVTTPVNPANVTITLFRPDGQPVHPDDRRVQYTSYGTTAIWAITQPTPGDWRVLMSGKGTVTVWKDYIPAPTPTPTPTPPPSPTPTTTPTAQPTPTATAIPRLGSMEWPPAALVGQPITLAVKLEPAIPQTAEVWAVWGLTETLGQRVQLYDDGRLGDRRQDDGIYSVVLTPEQVGIMRARVWWQRDGVVFDTWEGRAQVETQPALRLTLAQPRKVWRARSMIVAQADWLVHTTPLDMGGLLTMTLCDAAGALVATGYGAVGAPITLTAPAATGIYTMHVKAAGRTASGLTFAGEDTLPINVRRPLPAWVWGSGTTLTLALMGYLGGTRWYHNLPRLAGKLRVLKAPEHYNGAGLFDLSTFNQRALRLGGAGSLVPVPERAWGEIRALNDGSGIALTPLAEQTVTVNTVPIIGEHVLSDGDCIATQGLHMRYECLQQREFTLA